MDRPTKGSLGMNRIGVIGATEASPLQFELAGCMRDLGTERATWMGEKAIGLTGDFAPIDKLLDELHDIKRALGHYPDTDEGVVEPLPKYTAPAQGYQEAQS